MRHERAMKMLISAYTGLLFAAIADPFVGAVAALAMLMALLVLRRTIRRIVG